MNFRGSGARFIRNRRSAWIYRSTAFVMEQLEKHGSTERIMIAEFQY